jgi:hypothetical protein
MKTPITIQPVAPGTSCTFAVGLDPAGRPRSCLIPATMRVEKRPFCDNHAALEVKSICGLATTINRLGA